MFEQSYKIVNSWIYLWIGFIASIVYLIFFHTGWHLLIIIAILWFSDRLLIKNKQIAKEQSELILKNL